MKIFSLPKRVALGELEVKTREESILYQSKMSNCYVLTLC